MKLILIQSEGRTYVPSMPLTVKQTGSLASAVDKEMPWRSDLRSHIWNQLTIRAPYMVRDQVRDGIVNGKDML